MARRTIDDRADQLVALLRAGWSAHCGSGNYNPEVRVRKAGEPPRVFAYLVLRHLERRGRVRRRRTVTGLTWELR